MNWGTGKRALESALENKLPSSCRTRRPALPISYPTWESTWVNGRTQTPWNASVRVIRDWKAGPEEEDPF